MCAAFLALRRWKRVELLGEKVERAVCRSGVMSYVLGIDVGTTRMRCFALDKNGKALVSHFCDVEVLHPQPCHSEMDPEGLWQGFKEVVSGALTKAHLDPKDAACIGITCARNSFLLWNRSTGKPICNIITWQDRRAAQVCKDWNESMQFKFIHAGGGFMHAVTRMKRFLAASIIHLQTQHVAPRLYWALNNIEGAKQMAEEGKLCFGTVDSWILWKLTDGAVHATDYSHICTTVLFDPFQMTWSSLMFNVMGFPASILPEIKDSGGLFGHTAEHIFGASIPITGLISDATSATFAQGCWSPGDLKCTMGTGMFLCINTGSKPHASITGFYPVVGWKIGNELVYLAEANFPSCGSVVEWGKEFGLYSTPAQSENIAELVDNSDGVCFVPAFDGIPPPHNDPLATATMIGLTHNTRKEHIARALLESLAYTFKQLCDVACKENLKIKRVRVDGGVSQNNFILQLTSDLLGKTVERPKDVDMAVYGAIYVAGLSAGFWKSREEIQPFWELGCEFLPKDKTSEESKQILQNYQRWQCAVQRSLEWYKRDEIEHSNGE